MKNSALWLCLGLLCPLLGKAQLQNGGFEQGTGIVADYWKRNAGTERVNGAVHGGHTFQAVEGAHFMRLQTMDTIMGGVPLVYIPQLQARLGKIGYPDSIFFQAVYQPQIPEDGFIINFDFRKSDGSSALGLKLSMPVITDSTWTSIASRVSSYPFGFPDYDSLIITFSGVDPGQHDPQTGQPLYGSGTVLLLDAVTMKMRNTTGVHQLELEPAFMVQPSLVQEKVYIHFKESGQVLSVLDIQGKELLQQCAEPGASGMELDLRHLKAGYYWIQYAGHTEQILKQ